MSFIQLILSLATIYIMVLVVLILWKTRTHKAGRSFAWFLLSNALWTACAASMLPGYSRETIIFLMRATFFVATCMGISWVWFCAEFPRTSSSFRKLAMWLTIAGLPWLVLAWTKLCISGSTRAPWAENAEVGPAVLLFVLWIAACGVSGLIHLGFMMREVQGLERLQIRYILLGGIGLILLGPVPNLILPGITGSTQYAPLGPLAVLFISTSTTYAIVRYRLMDIKIVLRAGLIYSVTIGTLSLLFGLLVPIFNSILTDHFRFPQTSGSFLMAFVMALAFQPFRRYVQHLVDRWFFKSVYDYRVTLREAGNALASARDRELLVATLMNALVRTLRPRNVAVFLPGHDESLAQSSASGPWNDLPFAISEREPLISYAMALDEVLVAEELIRQPRMRHQVGLQMKEWRADIVVPLIASERLAGMVLLGEKLSGDVYTTDDIGLLRILGKQAAIALDNSRHFDEMVLLNEYHERMLHIMLDGVLALDPAGRVITFNNAAERITGVPAAQAMGKCLEEIGITQLTTLDTEGESIETSLTAGGGEEIPVLVTVTPFLRRWDVDPSYLMVLRDLSALRALEAEKMQAERFSSMGAMAASLAHEIKNPLVPIQMFAHMLPTHYDDEEFRKEFSVTVVKEVERINRLVGQMLDLVRKTAHDREPVDLRDIIAHLLEVINSECLRNSVSVHTHFDDHLPQIVGVAGQLYQAILNVMMNSVQAMPSGGDLFVDLRSTENAVICRIKDSGPGVSAEKVERIFEPLYTTKEGGHGLGLAITYQFVRSHGGEIKAESAPGEGLTVILTFPVWRPAEADLLCSSPAT